VDISITPADFNAKIKKLLASDMAADEILEKMK